MEPIPDIPLISYSFYKTVLNELLYAVIGSGYSEARFRIYSGILKFGGFS